MFKNKEDAVIFNFSISVQSGTLGVCITPYSYKIYNSGKKILNMYIKNKYNFYILHI